jgi:hypothetical protein
MKGFEELVELARRDLAGTQAGEWAPPPAPGHGPVLQGYLASGPRFRSALDRTLREIADNAHTFDLRAAAATGSLRRLLARVLNALLRLGGLGKYLGANQLRVNQATSRALGLLQARVLEQDRVLAEIAAARREPEPISSPDDARS